MAIISAASAYQIVGGKRGVAFSAHLSYRFLVPEKQAEALRKYLQEKYLTSATASGTIEKEVLTEFYFDDARQTLLKHNIMLRRRINVSVSDRKERIQLIFPAQKDSVTGQEVVFRHNRKPDTGDAYTTHPFLKLLRTKDRPILDSLLRPLQIQGSDLKPVLEMTQHREAFQLQKDNSNWIKITLSHIRAVNPENEIWQLQLSPDSKLLTHGAPEVRKALIRETQDLAISFKNQIPELQEQNQTDYAAMLASELKPTAKEIPGVIGYTLGMLVLLGILLWFFRFYNRHRRKKA